jgi:hypothetical protein
MPGLVGLNDMRANDYANVVIEVEANHNVHLWYLTVGQHSC